MEKQNKGYYTISELITGLRKHYIKNQDLLDKMNQMLLISSRYDTTSSLSLKLKDYNGLELDDPKVILTILKEKNSSIEDLREWILRGSNSLKNPANYCLIEKDERYYFKQDSKQDGTGPIVVVPSYVQDEFGSTYKELKDTKFYQLPSLFIRINPYQELFVWGDGLHLSNQDEVGRGIDISYDPIEDSISLDSSVHYSTGFANRLLDTKIPKYEFPEEYVHLLDEEQKMNRSLITEPVGRKKEILDLDEKEKIMLLRRR